jgi:hypothetical protein
MRFLTARRFALAACVPVLFLFSVVPGCSNESEGERCGDDLGPDNDDCASGLVCVSVDNSIMGDNRCCNADPSIVNDSRCLRTGNSSAGAGGGGGASSLGPGGAAGSTDDTTAAAGGTDSASAAAGATTADAGGN